MPIYAFKCDGCRHTFDEGLTVAVFTARRDDPNNGWRFMTCTRCRRKGRIVYDAIRQYQSQPPPQMDAYTFYENAPDEILRGKREVTVTKAEAKQLLSEHGMVEAGISAKQKRRSARVIDKGEIADAWEKRYGNSKVGPCAPIEKPVPRVAEPPRLARLPDPPPMPAEVKVPWADGVPPRSVRRKKKPVVAAKNAAQLPKVVDILANADLIIDADWLTVKRVSKRLQLNAHPSTKRPELERQIRERLNSTAATESA
jgi:hypothetical protein